MKTFRAYLKLFCSIFLMWIFAWHISPYLVENIPALTRIQEVSEEYDISPSALYYTDVSISMDAIQHTQNAVRFFSDDEDSKE